ncbi:Zinc finger, zz-type, partial [Globisporangium splendens]
MTSMAQHNFAAIQLQLQTLQYENSVLTKDLCLKENYIQLKDQQFRVMQKRLEDLESAVAVWKDKYLQQLNQRDASVNGAKDELRDDSASVNPNEDDSALPLPLRGSNSDAGSETNKASAPWQLWKGNSKIVSTSKTSSNAKNVQQAVGLMETLSLADREKLKPMLAAITNSDGFAEALAAMQWEEVFDDVSEELSKILLIYLLPVLLDNQKQHAPGFQIQCFSRTYAKQTMDFRIMCQPIGAASAAVSSSSALSVATAAAPMKQHVQTTSLSPTAMATASASPLTAASLASTAKPPPYITRSLSSSSNSVLPLSSPSSSEFSSALRSSTDVANDEPPHLFDCIDCEKRNAVPIPHGPRELHPTKAVYISKPLTGSAAAGASSGSAAAAASRRYSMTPTRGSTASTSTDSSRTMTLTSLSSPFSGVSGLSITDLGDGDRRSGGTGFGSGGAVKDGKIKKVLGSVMDRLNRHKPQLTTTSLSLEEDDSICDGCGRGPITGFKWVCRICRLMEDKEYELCEKCYGQGIHGKENEDALFERIEEIVISKCSRLASERELMKLLRVGICKANLKKFSFCLTWIADLLQCKQTKELRARALEISQIEPHVRSEFVRLLTDLLTRYRKDIELITEWQPVQATSAAAAVVAEDGKGGVTMLQLDTLRIWVKDSVDNASQ